MVKDKTITEINSDEKVCCALFDPARWQNTRHNWSDKIFIKGFVPEVFYVPLPGTYKKAISRMWRKAEEAGAAPGPDEFLLLAYDPSPFRSEVYMYMSKEVPGLENVKLSGIFYSKVFEGNYNDVLRCIKEMHVFLTSNNMYSKKEYICFPYCPQCAKKYGHNYIVVLAEVD